MKNQENIQIEPEVLEIPFHDDKNCPYSIMKIKNITEAPIRDLKFSIYNA